MDDDLIPHDAIFAEKQQRRDHREFVSIFGEVAVDTSEEGLARSAEGGAKLPQPNQIPPAVREQMNVALRDSSVRTVVDSVVRAVTGSGLDDIQKAIEGGTLGDLAAKLVDVGGNVFESVARKTAKESGLDAETTEKVTTVTGLLGGMLLPPGGGAKKLPKVGAEAAIFKGVKAGEQAMSALPPVKTGFVRLYRGEALPSGKKLPDWVTRGLEESGAKDAAKRWYTDDPKIAEWYLGDATAAGGKGHLKYVDVPPDVFEASGVAKNPAARKFSADPDREFFLPREWADRARPVEVARGVQAGPRAMAGTNPTRLGGLPDDVQSVIANVGTFNAQRMTQGSVPHAETIAKANKAMTLEQALRLDTSKYDLATLGTAVTGHYAAAASYFDDVAKRTAAGDVKAGAEYWTAFALASDLASKDALLGTQLGRGLEARKIPLGDVLSPEKLQEIAQTMAGARELGMDAATHASRVLALSPTQRKTAMRQGIDLLKAGQNALYEVWINGLLSGPQTHATNILSNTATAGWAPAERLLSAILDNPFNRDVYVGEAGAMLYGALEGMKDGIRLAGKALREGSGGVGQKIERVPAITAEAFGVNPEGTLGSAIDLIGAAIRTPGRLLMTEDAFFKAVNYRMELRALAYREAAAEGLSGRAFAERVRQILADPPPGVKVRADAFAHTQTFTQEFSALGRVGQMGSGVTMFAEGAPLGRVVVPFVRTPTNILHYASERTPVLNFVSDTLRSDLAGTNGPVAQVLARGKLASGALVGGVVASYAASYIDPEAPTAYMTVVTGYGPTAPAIRAGLERQGWKPFSVWNPLAKEYVSYNRLDPLGMVLGTVASATEIMGQIPEAGASELAMASVIAMGHAITSKTYMEGLSTFLDAMEGNAGDINRFFQSVARSGVPAGVRQTVRIMDPVKREMDGLFDYWRSGLPGYDGPAATNVWGDPVVFSGGLGPDLVSPLYTSSYKPDAVDSYLTNNRIALPKTPKVIAGRVPASVQLLPERGDEGVPLSKWARARLGELIGRGGEAADPGLLAGHPALKADVARVIAGPGTDGPTGSRADEIKKAYHRRREQAIEQLRREYPDLDTTMTKKMTERINRKIPGAGGLPSTLNR